VAELDGIWRVERTGGALPPLVGMTKRIRGLHGETRVGSAPGARFDVVDLELRYRTPFQGLVDVLEPVRDGELTGRATLFGREIGRFRMTREETAMTVTEQLVKHIDAAYAMEQSVLRMLDGMISTTDDADIVRELEHHKIQSEGHADRMKQRLQAHDATPSMVKEVGGILGALAKMPMDMICGEKAARNARDGYATEHMEIASYELLARMAERAGDAQTATAAREIIEDEREMARTIEQNWDRFVQLSLSQAAGAK
jgi:ferritin-like metal-binding protein YciE